uniref:Radial spoke head 1 homolog n=1 Tax=Chromera velia CCMP2878 TaxID=1169474 RepID=A0A0G4GJF7_9ALVE|mmetsp:Transcript_11123/g.21483  ORF Transcript_11123/g.21483 Transcript_11123/m.21483 type:complete len:261 (+) Transcript_11123:210-992(+)|eukprot:Cvel_22162.t1-p1 / transcript=Cvel_22162.t1 / gene=Cvel_22162 / organism=Chromera_velia_CCMP2878 / gene_product=Radial spoke head 1 homolog, putative / transcript_product=Radial spoke head 1 homolog, putative / location=Cvel_scaffold2151:12528-15306(-) / protein_length=260 / sequence_SO=supercontig / SO=protein_coding / is_pseudo=false
MAEEEEAPKFYFLETPEGETFTESRGYTGSGKATYKKEDDEEFVETYEGTFISGLRAGTGKYAYKNGDVYEGGFEDNDRHGLGRMMYKTEETEEGADEGEEEAKPKRGGSYYGEYGNGLRTREGTFKYWNGDEYTGSWLNGKKHGQGTYKFAKDGTLLSGVWEEGKVVTGKWMLPTGIYYVGPFRYNKPNGKGAWVFPNNKPPTQPSVTTQLHGEYLQKLEEAEEGEGGDEEGEAAKKDPKVTSCVFRAGDFAGLLAPSL